MESRKIIFITLSIAVLFSIFFCTRLQFQFDFEQFFPEGDEDLAFFKEFKSDFESDDNFLLIAVPNRPNVFDSAYLLKMRDASLGLKQIKDIAVVQSLATMRYPIKTPFGITSLPVIHIDDPQSYPSDQKIIEADKRLMATFVNEKMNMLVIAVKTSDNLSVKASTKLINSIDSLFNKLKIPEYHMLGRAYFQVELVNQQKRELLLTSSISAILVSVILFLIFRSLKVVVIAMASLGLSLLIFLGVLGALGRELNIMSALYPVLILIVGTSDIVHIMSKYFDELDKGKDKRRAMNITIKEIGLATLLTSSTTAIGFLTLYTSRLSPIQDFGLNAAIGVMIAFVVIILLSILVFPMLDMISRKQSGDHAFILWDKWLEAIYFMGRNAKNTLLLAFGAGIIICLIGIGKISTNYNVVDNLPKGSKITNDFLLFEREFSGFRPLEFAITVNSGNNADDFKVVKEIDKLENYLDSIPYINATLSQATLYKSINRMNNGNSAESYSLPQTEEEFNSYRSLLKKMRNSEATVLVNRDNTKTRLSSRVNDIGADSIRDLGLVVDKWIEHHIDGKLISVRRTGTGLIMDKNAVYVTESLLKGLLLAIVFISILMAFLLKSWKMIVLAFIPNFIPLLFAGALLGYFGIDLEAGVSIIFAVIFGIAVDDTIHFLSRFKICRIEGMDLETSIHTTFQETGKAIVFTTIILFFGFLVMLFSNNQPTFTVGLLVAVTLLSALICDLLLLPVLMRMWLKD